jgi:alkylation response protein AidB-like acyl-CoA dehydrogenase
MDLLPNDDQIALVDATANFIAKELRTDDAELAPLSRAALTRCADLGWFALAVPESDGGVGASIVDEMLVFRELGRALIAGPFVATALAGRLALSAGKRDLAERIFAGETIVAFAEPEFSGGPEQRARIFDHEAAALILVPRAKSLSLLVKPDSVPARCIDELTSMATADLAGAEIVVEATEPEGVRTLGWVLLSAMLTGITEATLNASVSYLKTREQFGRPIGAFQSLKHGAADMAAEAELALTLTTYAALSLGEGDPHARLYCLSARALTSRAALANARVNIQNHGAMGTTSENPAHTYLKRAHVLSQQFGGVHDPLVAVLAEPSPLAL